MISIPKVALFADTFHETNGAANFLRRLVDFAKDRNYPFLCVRSGDETRTHNDGSVSFVDLKRCRASIPIDGPLKYDPLIWRHGNIVRKTLSNFKPDIVHITGLNDISQLGITFAHFRNIPAVASWHTNAHEYAAQRLASVIPWIEPNTRQKITKFVERAGMYGLMKLYFLAQMQLAPNEELVAEIQRLTGRPSFLLGRGVDTVYLSPEKRKRCDDAFVIGFVGRLRPEKNIRFLGKLSSALQNAGVNNHRFLIVGEGSERAWLLENLPNADLTGVIHGEELARAYANMDLFVFPSQTDAFGNVVLEAMASGVPAVVMKEGGPKFLIEHGRNGFITGGDEDFIDTVVQTAKDPYRLPLMKQAARSFAEAHSWTAIFEKIYEYYEMGKGFRKNIRA
ncbi:MAG: glycosyltransferase [Pyrinomonadaceae bacterium]|nr:glycosyltransferase [Blastocatellia bacterium]MDQ3489780.1 glycosyltransferase [Acidobacteriota bacterium]